MHYDTMEDILWIFALHDSNHLNIAHVHDSCLIGAALQKHMKIRNSEFVYSL